MELTRLEKTAGELRVLGVKITVDGRDVYEKFWDDDCRRNLYSASKSVTALAVGFAEQEGLLSLDEKLTEAFAEDLPEQPDANLQKAAVRDLLTMCLGQKEGFLMGAQRPRIPEEDWVKAALKVPFVYEPGTHFVYNNVGPYLAGILVQRRAGCDLVSYLMPRLFKPLGIRRTVWEVDPLGRTFGAGGLFLTLGELHKLGLFCLQDGMWNGRQLLNSRWIRACMSRQVETGWTDHGYGYLFWGGAHGSFMANGKYGQYTVVLREKKAVVTIMAESRSADTMLNAILDEVWPML